MNTRATWILATLLLIPLATIALPQDHGAPTAAAISTDLAAELQAIVDRAVDEEHSVALSCAVAIGAELVLTGGYGPCELEHGVESDADTLFRIGSITKQFTAAAVMQLVEAGLVELDADMRTYLPEFPEKLHVVTVRHLLTHSSGIPSYTGLGEGWERTVPLEMTHRQMLDFFADEPLEFEPGARFRYNNSGYYLLGMLIEAVSGKTYAEFLSAEVFAPAGLTRTRCGSNSDVIRNRAQGYLHRDGAFFNDELIGMTQPGAAGALLSTASELVRWSHALAHGEVVEAASYELMTTPYALSSGEPNSYGFGLGVGARDGRARVAHGGGINGFNSMLIYFPETQVAVAVISNCENFDSGEVAAELAHTVLAFTEN